MVQQVAASPELPPDDGLDPSLVGGAGIGPGGGIDSFGEKTDLDKIFEMMLDPRNIDHFTELNSAEITAFSTLGSMAEKYMPNGVIHGWLLKNLRMRVSKQRKGKTETVKITSRLPADMQQQRSGGWGFFRGN